MQRVACPTEAGQSRLEEEGGIITPTSLLFFIFIFKDLHIMCTRYLAVNLDNFNSRYLGCSRAVSPSESAPLWHAEEILKHLRKRCLLIAICHIKYLIIACIFVAFAYDGAALTAKATFQVMSQLCCGCKSNNY